MPNLGVYDADFVVLLINTWCADIYTPFEAVEYFEFRKVGAKVRESGGLESPPAGSRGEATRCLGDEVLQKL